MVELGVLVGFLIVWELTHGNRSAGAQRGLLAIAAAALGIKSSAVQRCGVLGLSSTHLTGALTTQSAPWWCPTYLGRRPSC